MSVIADDCNIAMVGGGILGLAVARELKRCRPDASVVVFEREREPAQHQTGHNSGVVHAGIYYRPGRSRRGSASRALASYTRENAYSTAPGALDDPVETHAAKDGRDPLKQSRSGRRSMLRTR